MRTRALVLMWVGLVQTAAAQVIIEAPDPSFGHALELDGQFLAVGAPAYNQGQGGLWVYAWTGDYWQLRHHTRGSDGDSLGYSLALEGDLLLAGAPGARRVCWYELDSGLREFCVQSSRSSFGRAVALTGIFAAVGSPANDRARGAVDLYIHAPAATWQHQAELIGEADQSAFGAALAMNSETLLIGAPLADEPRGREAGLAYVYNRTSGSDWVLRAVLTAGDAGFGHHFGHAVALSVHQENTYAILGAPEAQMAYLFVHRDTIWQQTDIFRPVPAMGLQQFGHSVDLDRTIAVIGSPSGLSDRPGAVWILDIDEFHNWYLEHRLQGGPAFGHAVRTDGSAIVIAEAGRAIYSYRQTALGRSRSPAKPPPLSAFPNPFSGPLTLELAPDVSSVRIWDLSGRLIATLSAQGRSQAVWHPGNLPAGVYWAESMGSAIRIVYLP